jgi:hypothetical protein
MSEKSAQDTTRVSVLDELVFVGRSGPANRDGTWVHRRYMPVLADPEPDEPPLSAGQLVLRGTVLTLLAAAIILVIGLGIGYAG